MSTPPPGLPVSALSLAVHSKLRGYPKVEIKANHSPVQALPGLPMVLRTSKILPRFPGALHDLSPASFHHFISFPLSSVHSAPLPLHLASFLCLIHSTLQKQGLCTCWSPAQNATAPAICLAPSSLCRYQLKHPLLMEILSCHPKESGPHLFLS